MPGYVFFLPEYKQVLYLKKKRKQVHYEELAHLKRFCLKKKLMSSSKTIAAGTEGGLFFLALSSLSSFSVSHIERTVTFKGEIRKGALAELER